MINWDNIRYNIESAANDFEKLEINLQSIVPINLDKEFTILRNQLIQARNKIYDEQNFDYANKLDYSFDLLFGLKLYKILNNEMNFTARDATNNDVWRYLSVRVIPDIVHSRWDLNADHFFKISRRIWLKTIWWYVHLSWHIDEEGTYQILKNNTTDTILQLVERPGIGFNEDVFREIMLQYKHYDDSSRELFRHVLKLNTAQLKVRSPELVKGGVVGYVEKLFETVKE